MRSFSERTARVKRNPGTGVEQELHALIGTPAPSFLDVFLDLFDGNPVPAILQNGGFRPGWHPAPSCSFRTAVRAHLVGVAWVGMYAFRGVLPGCGCADGRHTCHGRGTMVFGLDLDAHRGESDIPALATRLFVQFERFGFRPLVFSSRSGRGLHFYVFLSEAVTTEEAHAAAEVIRRAAGIGHDRCQSYPSAAHDSGLGSFMALPLNPMSRERGGGLLMGDGLRPVLEERAILAELLQAHIRRNSAATVRALAQAPVRLDPRPVESIDSTGSTSQVTVNPDAPEGTPRPEGAKEPARRSIWGGGGRGRRKRPSDAAILAAMTERHPQYKRALAVKAEDWKGGRSARDAYLAAFMARQGVSAKGIVDALEALDGTKTAERGAGYGERLMRYRARTVPTTFDAAVILAGEPLPNAARRPKPSKYSSDEEMDGEVAHGDRVHEREGVPWPYREAPPRGYAEGTPNPWWSVEVQLRLRDPKRRSRALPLVLAYVIDYGFRGPFRGKQFFLSARMIATALNLPVRTTANAVGIISRDFTDIVTVTHGVPHAILRLATAFIVKAAPNATPIEWTSSASQGPLTIEGPACNMPPNGDGSDAGMEGTRREHARARPLPVLRCAGCRPEAVVRVPAEDRHDPPGAHAPAPERAGRGEPLRPVLDRGAGVAPHAARVVPHAGRAESPPGLHGGGREERRLLVAAGAAVSDDVRGASVPERPAAVHRGHRCGVPEERTRRARAGPDESG